MSPDKLPAVRPETPQKYKTLRRREVTGQARALNFTCFHGLPMLRFDRTCRWLAEAVERALATHECDLWAYCFMPTHAHLLVRPRSDPPDMARFVASVKQSVAKRAVLWVRAHSPGFLERMRDSQPNGKSAFRFWQRGGGYDRNLWSAKAIWNMIDYIHRNPVADKLCTRSADWLWSSASFYQTGADGPLRLSLELRPDRP